MNSLGGIHLIIPDRESSVQELTLAQLSFSTTSPKLARKGQDNLQKSVQQEKRQNRSI